MGLELRKSRDEAETPRKGSQATFSSHHHPTWGPTCTHRLRGDPGVQGAWSSYCWAELS